MAWTNIFPITPPAPDVRNQWTRAIIRNRLFIFQQGLLSFLEVDTSIPGEVTMLEPVPTFLNMAGIEGIFGARSRLGAWDTENSIYWGDTADLLDFEPSLITRANVVKVDALKGNIITVLPTAEGFIVYTTSNIVGAQYVASEQKVFDFFEISDNLGIFSDYSVTIGEDGKHYAWTNGGLYRVTATKGGVEPVAPEVADYIMSFEQSPRLSYHLNRYLAIWLHDERVDFARTIRQRNFVDEFTYWRQRLPYEPEYLENPPNFLTALNPFGTDFFDRFPYTCFPEVPDKCDTITSVNTLWAMATEDFPLFELEKVNVDFISFPDPPTTPIGQGVAITTRVDPLTGELTDVAPSAPTSIYRLTQGTFDKFENDPFIAARPFVRFSFDPHELLMYQSYIWQNEDDSNFQHLFDNSIMQDIDSVTVNIRYVHNKISKDIAVQLVGSTVEVDDLITEDTKTGSYDVGFSADPTDGPQGTITFINIRTTIVEEFATKLRTTTLETVTSKYEYIPVQTVVPGGDGGIQDGNIIATQAIDDIVRADSLNQGADYIGLEPDFPTIFHFDGALLETVESFAQLSGSDEEWKHRPVSNLGFKNVLTDGPPAAGYQFWSTASTINAVTDRCTYASVRNHAKNRATTEFHRVGTLNTILEFVGDDSSGDSIYIHRIEQTHTIDYQLDRLYPELPNFPTADTEIPIKKDIRPLAIAVLTKPDGTLPAAVLQTYYEDSVIQGVSILDIYAQNGWTVTTPGGGSFTAVDLLISGGESPNIYNNVVSGTFLEYFQTGLQCTRLLQQGLWPFDIDTAGKFQPFETPTIPDITLPETIFLTQTGAPGPLYPTYTRVIIFDRLLERWGTADLDFRLFLDYSPINEVTYDPILEESVTRFTFDNFLSRLGGLLVNGMHTQFDDQPEDSWIVYGKIGWRRSKMTMMQEIFLEFAENPNANIILESSLDRRTLDPYNLRSEQITRAGHTWHGTVTARWFNIVIRGKRYHLTGMEFMGSPLGRE